MSSTPDTPQRCMACGHAPHAKDECQLMSLGWRCKCSFYVQSPQPDERVECEITTQWTCPFCQADQEVGGAAMGWMECQACLKAAWLDPA